MNNGQPLSGVKIPKFQLGEVRLRKTNSLSKLMLGVAVSGIWVPQAFAQSTSTAEASTQDANRIIVTARRVEESVQDVPLTVNVVTDQELQELNLFNGSDLESVVPGLKFSPNLGGGSTPVVSLRGAARGDAQGRLDPTVQTYLNEAPVSDGLVYQALYDIGQVEVLRGPQGTLRGRPSAAGAITFTTKRPDLDEITGNISVAVSTLDQVRGEAAIGLPIIEDVLAVRVAGIVDRNDNGGVRSLFHSQDPYHDLTSWRASVRFEPTDNLDINVMYQDLRSERATLAQVAGTGYRGPSTPINPVVPILPANFNGPAISPLDRLSVSDSFSIRDELFQNLIGQVGFDLGSHRIVYVGEYAYTRSENSGGTNSGHFYPIPAPRPEPIASRTTAELITQELRFETTGADFWDYGVGIYYEKSTSESHLNFLSPNLPGTYGNPRAPSLAAFNYDYSLIIDLDFPVDYENKAIYANSTFHITPDTDLFVGLRHIWYTQTSDQTGSTSSGFAATGSPLLLCDGVTALPFNPEIPGAIPSTRLTGQCDFPVPSSIVYTSNPLVSEEQAWVYNASLTHRISDDITIYGTFGHSWRPQTNNLNLGSTDPRVQAFATTRSETSDNFELGLKMQFLDRRLTANIAAFYQDYSGFLYTALGVPYVSNIGTGLTVANAGALTTNADGKVKGFDLELAYRASSQFSISANLNYARGRLSDESVPCNDSNGDGVQDNGTATVASFGTEVIRFCNSSASLAYQADWNASLQSEYNFPVTEQVNAYIRGLVSYTPRNNFAPGATDSNPFPVDDYALVNLFLGIRSTGQWDFGLYGRNLTDVTMPIAQGVSEILTPSDAQSVTSLGVAPSTGYRTVNLTPRREFGATLRISF